MDRLRILCQFSFHEDPQKMVQLGGEAQMSYEGRNHSRARRAIRLAAVTLLLLSGSALAGERTKDIEVFQDIRYAHKRSGRK